MIRKAIIILMTAFLLFTLCACGEKTTKTEETNLFKEGNLLFDLGAKSLDDIEKVEFLYEDFVAYSGENLEITDKEDIKILCDYTFYGEYEGELHELFVFPTNSIYITVNGAQHQVRLGDDGSLTTVPGNRQHTYKAEDGKGVTKEIWQSWIEKYK